jgi:hypothetical protein
LIFILRERVTVRKAIGLVSALAALAALAGSWGFALKIDICQPEYHVRHARTLCDVCH